MTVNSPSFKANVRAIRHLSPIWLVPIVAALIGLWLVYVNFTNQGPLITLVMKDADGIEAGKTMIKARSVEVGTVQSITLSKDLSHVILTARMAPGTQGLLKADSQWWVVKPRVGRQGISGLGTLLSGAYIELQPGKSSNRAHHFQVLDTPPLALPDEKGIHIELSSEQNRGLSASDPVTYRGFNVGRVEKVSFSPLQRQMEYQLFIRAPYDALVTRNVRFWLNNGMRIEATSEGINVETGTFESLLRGGVSFDVPSGWPLGKAVQNGQRFTLFADQKSSRRLTFEHHLYYVLEFNDSVRGLNRGAPVEYRGIQVGRVVEVPYQQHLLSLVGEKRRSVPVLIQVEPGRLLGDDSAASVKAMSDIVDQEVKRGLQASLKMGNLLAGALYVDLDYHHPVPQISQMAKLNGYPVLPTAPGGIARLEQQTSALLNKLNKLPLEQTLSRMDNLLGEAKQSFVSIHSLSNDLDALVKQPAAKGLPDELNRTVKSLQKTLDAYSANSPAYGNLNQAIENLNALLRQLQPVARSLSEKSNALIFSQTPATDPQPRSAKP